MPRPVDLVYLMMPMTTFVDPRADLKPCATKPPARTTIDPGALAELHQFCREGRLYDVEGWIRAGRPLQVAPGTTVKGRRLTSALEIALEAKNHALVLLLLCNGYDLNIEPGCPLDLALRARRWDLVDMLLEWGADVQRVSLCDLFDTYDPHAPVPSLRYPTDVDEDDDECEEADRFLGWTAVEEACSHGKLQILERLGPDPARDDFDKLFQRADNEYVIKFLARSRLPKDVGAVVRSQFFWMEEQPFGFGHPRSVDTIRPLFEAGARWETSAPDDIAAVRRSLLRMSDYNFVNAIKVLASNDYCSAAVLHDLGRTPTMRARMKKVGFIPPAQQDKWDPYRPRPTRSREVLSKFGVEVRKAKPRLPSSVQIGDWRPGGRTIQLDRAALFERVWSEPVERLAQAWGLSGRGLSKACQRLQIPVPPRGFWARVQHGQKVRRPRLPELPPGEAEEIVIGVPE